MELLALQDVARMGWTILDPDVIEVEFATEGFRRLADGRRDGVHHERGQGNQRGAALDRQPQLGSYAVNWMPWPGSE